MVVAIIAVLAALLLPALKGARDQAKATTCANNIRQFLIANELFMDDHGEMLVPNRGYSDMSNTNSAILYWQGLLDAYMGGKAVVGSSRTGNW